MAERALSAGQGWTTEDVIIDDRFSVLLGWRIRRHLTQKFDQMWNTDCVASSRLKFCRGQICRHSLWHPTFS